MTIGIYVVFAVVLVLLLILLITLIAVACTRGKDEPKKNSSLPETGVKKAMEIPQAATIQPVNLRALLGGKDNVEFLQIQGNNIEAFVKYPQVIDTEAIRSYFADVSLVDRKITFTNIKNIPFEDVKSENTPTVELAPAPIVQESPTQPTHKGHPVLVTFIVLLVAAGIGGGIYLGVKNTENSQFNKGYNNSGLVVKKRPDVSIETKNLGLTAVFKVHCNDNYDRVVVSYKFVAGGETISSGNLVFTTLTKGQDYTKEVDVSNSVFSSLFKSEPKIEYTIASYD
jgi:hypothetical protein